MNLIPRYKLKLFGYLFQRIESIIPTIDISISFNYLQVLEFPLIVNENLKSMVFNE